jgi:hypothetical protein
MLKWTRIVGLSLVFTAIVCGAQIQNAYSQQICLYGKNSSGVCFACLIGPSGTRLGGTGPGTIKPKPGGTGCGDCAEDPEYVTTNDDYPLVRGDDWVIDVQDLFPDSTLVPGTIATVALVRSISSDTEPLLQPLIAGQGTALYMVEIGEDGNTEFSFGSISESIVGGNYRAYALPREINSEQDFWQSIMTEPPGIQTYNVNNLVTVDANSVRLDEYRRLIDLPVTVDTSAVESEIAIRLKNYPDATTPFQVGVYSEASISGEQGRVEVFSPGEYLIDRVIEPFVPTFAEQLRDANPYFQANEYEYEVYVDGVLESSGTVEFPYEFLS